MNKHAAALMVFMFLCLALALWAGVAESQAQRTVVIKLDYADARVIAALFGGWAPPPPARVPMWIPEHRPRRHRVHRTGYLDLGQEREHERRRHVRRER